jgi:hypothetical protein
MRNVPERAGFLEKGVLDLIHSEGISEKYKRALEYKLSV